MITIAASLIVGAIAGFFTCALLTASKRRDVDISDAFTERRVRQWANEREQANPALRVISGGRR